MIPRVCDVTQVDVTVTGLSPIQFERIRGSELLPFQPPLDLRPLRVSRHIQAAICDFNQFAVNTKLYVAVLPDGR